MDAADACELLIWLAEKRGWDMPEFYAAVGDNDSPQFFIVSAAKVLDLPPDLMDDATPLIRALVEYA